MLARRIARWVAFALVTLAPLSALAVTFEFTATVTEYLTWSYTEDAPWEITPGETLISGRFSYNHAAPGAPRPGSDTVWDFPLDFPSTISFLVDGEVGLTQLWESAQVAIEANDIERFGLVSYTDAPASWGVDWSRVNLGFVSGQGGLLTPGELPTEIDLADWAIVDQLLVSGWSCINPLNCSNHGQQWVISADVTNLLELSVRPEIDIKPDGDLNSINPESRGVVPVAVLGSDSFDVADVDVATLAFGPAGASPSNRRGPRFEDLDGDGLADLIAHFGVEESGIAFGDTLACLTGETLDGTPFEGCDAVRTVPRGRSQHLLD